MIENKDHDLLPDLSLVIPVYNERESLSPLFKEIDTVRETLSESLEVVVVDDGSTDGSFEELKRLQKDYPFLRVIQFRRNFGKAAALSCAFERARGSIILTLDADLQDDPMEIPRFIETIRQGVDVVSGWKYPRLDPFSKRIPSKVFNGLVNLFCDIQLHDINCGFKAYRKEVLQSIGLYGGRYRFLPVFAKNFGFKVSEIKIHHRPRVNGTSKYGGRRFIEGFFDLLTVILMTRFRKVPLHFFGSIGLVSLFAGFCCCLYLSLLWFQGITIGHRPLLMLGVLLIILGVQLFGVGLLGELMVESRKDDPTYIIKSED